MRATRYELSHLDMLEAESIHIMREVAAEFERPVLLFSGGKDSIVMLRLAEKAFWPAKPRSPLMHVDTGHNFPEVIEYRDRRVARAGGPAGGGQRPGGHRRRERSSTRPGPRASRNQLQTPVLLEAIEEHQFDAVFGGARRDEEKARAKERVYSFRDEFGQWDPKNQRPELWSLYNGRHKRGQHIRVFPLSNWTELDIWQYIDREGIEIPSIYFAHKREVFRRDGMLLAFVRSLPCLTARRPAHRDGPLPHCRRHELHRRRAVRWHDRDARSSMRSRAPASPSVAPTRADDKVSEAAMEDRKREGYF